MDIFNLIAQVGAPIAGALVMGLFIFVIMKQIFGRCSRHQVKTLEGFFK